MLIGQRVVRGPDWKWDNQDGGEGHLGTIIEVKEDPTNKIPVWVYWDHGSKANYRCGKDNAYDLRLYDNAPAGVEHSNITCDACGQVGVKGMRWKCSSCYDYDLCTKCYMSDKHDIDHCFKRFETSMSEGIPVPKRNRSIKVQAKGMFEGATVVRGLHWKWGSQDGSPGRRGKIVSVGNWGAESGNSAARVRWDGQHFNNNYRLGQDGKVDLKCLESTDGGYCYRDHLPLIGKSFPARTKTRREESDLRIGDKVRIELEVDTVKLMQKGHGGWSDNMTECFGHVGDVLGITSNGDYRVKFKNTDRLWIFNEAVLVKINKFSVGDTVRLLTDAQRVSSLQDGHGGWNEHMKESLGKIGKIIRVDSDGDVYVHVDGKRWCLNPDCCTLVKKGEGGTSNDKDDMDSVGNALASLVLGHLLSQLETHISGPASLVAESARGNLAAVRKLLSTHKNKIDQKQGSHTALQVASHEGHLDVVQELISAGANLEVQDDDGDSALTFAVIGDKPAIAKLLISKGADVSIVNNRGNTPLLIATKKQHAECVKILLEAHADTRQKDHVGDTALHDAIALQNDTILDLLVKHQEIDLWLRNDRGFAAIHHAALKNNNYALRRILIQVPQSVDDKKDDGFTALHLAAFNGHAEAGETLITQGKANIESLTNGQHTPLHLSTSRGHLNVVSLLVSKGAKVNAVDQDGDNSLHLTFQALAGMGSESRESYIQIASHLALHGVDIHRKNHKKQTPIDIAPDAMIIKKVTEAAATAIALGLSNPVPATQTREGSICMLCFEDEAEIKLEPCGHVSLCEECSENNKKMKKCPDCKEVIERRMKIVAAPPDQNTDEIIRKLERTVEDMQSAMVCPICMENPRNIAFLCGHCACSTCADKISDCHFCRKKIEGKINLF